MISVRLVTEDDVPAITDLLRRSREHLAPWEPLREDSFFTEASQRATTAALLERHTAGTHVPLVIVDDDEVVGRITVNDVVRGAFQSASIGYWVGAGHTGRGVATAAVAATVRLAFDELHLHRLQADTLLHNTASQAVLARNGFVRIGTAPRYLRIAGRWQDHHLHQLVDEHHDPA
ncbi:GNAT family N-acetyltransferase [Quadrisphaera setariae]|uniref:GNAT family N-acetyltransferase n=1 Tax=Quadrisphaera setariae TaxID=2593304 RepID=A0A5C8ZC47_9ACTN|nr:GNAT family N-acetyltransferase [Quadrisphaera setariae]TXR55685.1 GNAT family N-acetyltransferase [Quadrisphaera setariae]